MGTSQPACRPTPPRTVLGALRAEEQKGRPAERSWNGGGDPPESSPPPPYGLCVGTQDSPLARPLTGTRRPGLWLIRAPCRATRARLLTALLGADAPGRPFLPCSLGHTGQGLRGPRTRNLTNRSLSHPPLNSIGGGNWTLRETEAKMHSPLAPRLPEAALPSPAPFAGQKTKPAGEPTLPAPQDPRCAHPQRPPVLRSGNRSNGSVTGRSHGARGPAAGPTSQSGCPHPPNTYAQGHTHEGGPRLPRVTGDSPQSSLMDSTAPTPNAATNSEKTSLGQEPANSQDRDAGQPQPEQSDRGQDMRKDTEDHTCRGWGGQGRRRGQGGQAQTPPQSTELLGPGSGGLGGRVPG